MLRKARKPHKAKVLVGLSGGVDSAVSAYLLQEAGFEVEGVFMKNWSSTAGLKVSDCPWLADRQEALRVAAFLGIPLHTVDFEREYEAHVMRYFFAEYKAGRTPNPDVMCNKEIKFKVLYKWAMKQGFDYLATGHYARIGKSKNTKKRSSSDVQSITYNLLRSADEFKDQTYFIYNIKTGQLPHLLFPIGGMKKTAVKKLAKRIGLPNAARKESMGLCFVGKIRLKDFLEQQVTAKRGPIVLLDAREGSVSGALPVIGQHEGLHNYTIGQRQGINVGGPGGPYYVVRKDLVKNTLYVTADPNNPALKVSEVQVHSVNWIANYHLPSTLMCRYRHQGELVSCGIEEAGKDVYVVKFKAPQKALASGQSVVFYQGRKCLGGGVIV